jgi:glycerophosphoryl diester phosphodiesterase
MLSVLAAVVMAGDLLPKAHAHNDYDQQRPLVGAMELGFGSIEADVYLVDGKLLVGHNRKDLKPDRTLDGMYLRPLATAIKAHHGHVYKERGEVILLVDIKADGPGVYEELKRELRPYEASLTHYSDGKVETRALTVILSGERPTQVLDAEKSRVAFIDGRPEDIGRPASLVPLVSQDWTSLFKWNGVGAIPVEESARLADLVKSCHEHGQKLRFWATPESVEMWRTLDHAGVDLIGTDRQKELAEYFRKSR